MVRRALCGKDSAQDPEFVVGRLLTVCVRETLLGAFAARRALQRSDSTVAATQLRKVSKLTSQHEPVGVLGMSVLRRRRGTGPVVRILLQSCLRVV
jgi:hypothetical protein